eukprot:scaffold3326_cov52-Attheya_sp.AAC.1
MPEMIKVTIWTVPEIYVKRFILLSPEFGIRVGHLNCELFCPLNNFPPNPGANGMSNSCGIGTVVHHEHLEFAHIGNDNSLESVWVDIACFLVATVSNGRHGKGSLKATTDTSINTFRFTPR